MQRLQLLARAPLQHAEPLQAVFHSLSLQGLALRLSQVGRYEVGEFYQTHFDSEPEQGVRRAATVLIYLEPPEA